jgi:hypothetical protein
MRVDYDNLVHLILAPRGGRKIRLRIVRVFFFEAKNYHPLRRPKNRHPCRRRSFRRAPRVGVSPHPLREGEGSRERNFGASDYPTPLFFSLKKLFTLIDGLQRLIRHAPVVGRSVAEFAKRRNRLAGANCVFVHAPRMVILAEFQCNSETLRCSCFFIIYCEVPNYHVIQL